MKKCYLAIGFMCSSMSMYTIYGMDKQNELFGQFLVGMQGFRSGIMNEHSSGAGNTNIMNYFQDSYEPTNALTLNSNELFSELVYRGEAWSSDNMPTMKVDQITYENDNEKLVSLVDLLQEPDLNFFEMKEKEMSPVKNEESKNGKKIDTGNIKPKPFIRKKKGQKIKARCFRPKKDGSFSLLALSKQEAAREEKVN